MRRGLPTLEKGPQPQRARVNERVYSERDQQLEHEEQAHAFAAAGFLRGERLDDAAREAARRLLNVRFARIQLVATAFNGRALRLEEYPSDLRYEGRVFVQPEPQHIVLFRGEQPYARLEVRQRTYVFFLPLAGYVDAFDNGMHRGGNCDLRYYEIFGQIRGNDWFGCERC